MNELELKSLQEAVDILQEKECEVVNQSHTVWLFLYHARESQKRLYDELDAKLYADIFADPDKSSQ